MVKTNLGTIDLTKPTASPKGVIMLTIGFVVLMVAFALAGIVYAKGQALVGSSTASGGSIANIKNSMLAGGR